MAEDEAREGEEWEASVSDECLGVDKCHGCLGWCDMCEDVKHVCDMRLRGELCDEHPVPPTWQVLAIARREALRHIEEGNRMVREGGSMTHASAWRAHLIEATEILHFADATMRERLRDVLELQIQQMLADKDEGPALWAAVRRIGTLLSDGEAERLISLLEVDRLVTTKQVALQALEQLCLRSSISAEVGTVRLCDAVYAILRDLIAMDAEVRSAEQDALLINSLLVCAVLGDGRAVEEARRFASQVDKLFRGLIVKRLEAATAALRARKNDGAPTSRRLTNVEAILAVLPS